MTLRSPYIGFTGTQHGLSMRQLKDLDAELRYLWKHGARVLVHGLCIGGDEQCHDLAVFIGYATWGHPGFAPGHPKRSSRVTTWLEPVKSPLIRNHTIVDRSCFMLAAPSTAHEVLRSGTWATIRYLKHQRVQHVLITP